MTRQAWVRHMVCAARKAQVEMADHVASCAVCKDRMKTERAARLRRERENMAAKALDRALARQPLMA